MFSVLPAGERREKVDGTRFLEDIIRLNDDTVDDYCVRNFFQPPEVLDQLLHIYPFLDDPFQGVPTHPRIALLTNAFAMGTI